MSQSASAALAFLNSRLNFERVLAPAYGQNTLKLERMRELVARLGDPHKKYPIVHIAGTKGKGSTSYMVAGILTAAGYRMGMYTSPHLDRLEERFVIDGQPCAEEELIALIEHVRPVALAMDAQARSPLEIGPTYFELTTAMALLHFAWKHVNGAVLEVGLGGRLDSTNICEPAATLITSISFDHTRQLGNTLAAIAAEKAGIVKPGVPLISGVVEHEPRDAIRAICALRGAPTIELGLDFDFEYLPPANAAEGETAQLNFRSLHSPAVELRRIDLGMLGRHQAANAAAALALVVELRRQGWNIPESAVRAALAACRPPARIELASRRPKVVIDAAHNVASVQALLQTLAESLPARRKILVFGTTREKDVPGMLRLLLPWFDLAIFTRYQQNPRGIPPEELAESARELGYCPTLCPTPEQAWDKASCHLHDDDLVCVTGSFFLAAEMKAVLSAVRLGV
jgi:dihydrofolate synthase/folylpolyglutamate synthase